MWALIGWLFVLAVTLNMTKSWMIAAAAGAVAGGGDHSGVWFHNSWRKLKSVSIAGTYITVCVCVCA